MATWLYNPDGAAGKDVDTVTLVGVGVVITNPKAPESELKTDSTFCCDYFLRGHG
jgi:hypothetical protein